MKDLFLKSRDILLDKIIQGKPGTKTYYNTVLQQLNKEMARLQKGTVEEINKTIPKEYKKHLDEIYNYFKSNNLTMKEPSIWASIHTDSINELIHEMAIAINQGIAQAGRRVFRYLNEARDETLRQLGLEESTLKYMTGSTVKDMRDRLVEKLDNNGFMTVQYGRGKRAYQVPLDVYADMVARSTTREAGNLARRNQLSVNGYDLVMMSTHYPTCEICAPLQGKVYSVSGNDKRFPALMEVAFKSGYMNVHPNCRHVISAWVESLKTPNEIKEAIEFSNKPIKDPRSKKEINLYNKQQKENRLFRKQLREYEKYKMEAKEPMSFREFRRAVI